MVITTIIGIISVFLKLSNGLVESFLLFFETKIAKYGVSDEEVLQLLDYPIVFKLLNIPLPENRNGILDKLNEEHIIIPSYYNGKPVIYVEDFGYFELNGTN